MRWFTSSARPTRPGPVRRTRLWLETLADRAVPGSLAGDDPAEFVPLTTSPTMPSTESTLLAPSISPLPYPEPPSTNVAPPPPDFAAPTDGAPPPAPTAPEIVEFAGEEIGGGWYYFTGRVTASPTAGGITVTFGGLPSLTGQTVVTASDGTFSLFIQLQTNGSDNGTATAQAAANGYTSNLAMWDVRVTP